MLLIVVIGGMGTMYGPAIGAVLLVLAQNYLQDLLRLVAGEGGALAGVPVLGALVSPRSVAAVAGRAVRAVGLLLSVRDRGSPEAGSGRAAFRRGRLKGCIDVLCLQLPVLRRTRVALR